MQSFLRFLTEVPQTYHHPYILYVTFVRLLRVPIAMIHLVGWVLALRQHPVIALGFLASYVHSMIPTYRAFWATYPYMFSLRNLLAAIAVDFSPIPIGLWGIFTINADSWVHGDGTTAKKQPGIANGAAEKLEALAHTTGDTVGQLLAGTWPPTVLSGQPCLSGSNHMGLGHTSDQNKESPMASSEEAEQVDAHSKKEQ